MGKLTVANAPPLDACFSRKTWDLRILDNEDRDHFVQDVVEDSRKTVYISSLSGSRTVKMAPSTSVKPTLVLELSMKRVSSMPMANHICKRTSKPTSRMNKMLRSAPRCLELELELELNTPHPRCQWKNGCKGCWNHRTTTTMMCREVWRRTTWRILPIRRLSDHACFEFLLIVVSMCEYRYCSLCFQKDAEQHYCYQRL